MTPHFDPATLLGMIDPTPPEDKSNTPRHPNECPLSRHKVWGECSDLTSTPSGKLQVKCKGCDQPRAMLHYTPDAATGRYTAIMPYHKGTHTTKPYRRQKDPLSNEGIEHLRAQAAFRAANSENGMAFVPARDVRDMAEELLRWRQWSAQVIPYIERAQKAGIQ